MFTILLKLIREVKLSLVEWLAVTAAAVIGVLVIALRVQGTLLHRAQIHALQVDRDTKEAKASEETEDARGRYTSALMEYLKAGGTLALLLALSCGKISRGDGVRLPRCTKALAACSELVRSQDIEVQVLKQSTVLWRAKAEESAPGLLQVVPWPVWTILGGAVGYGLGRAIR